MPPSGAPCHTCKTRHIKCDFLKPVCERCTKSNRVCIAAFPPSLKHKPLEIHLENQYASGRNKRPRGPRSKIIVHPTQEDIDIETKTLAYYTQYHLQTVPDAPITVGGLSECIASWKASGREDVMVNLALAAMALAVYSQAHNDLEAEKAAACRYHQLLKIVQERIAKVELPSSNADEIDACALTIFIMGRYEGVMFNDESSERDSFQVLHSWSHHEGAMAILKVWYDKLRDGPVSEIVKQTRRGQIRSAIIRSRCLPDWLLDGEQFGESGVELEYDYVITKIVRLRQTLACYRQHESFVVEEVKRLSQEAQAIDDELAQWIEQMAKTYPRQLHSAKGLSNLPTTHIYSSKIYTFTQHWHAGVWTQYYGAKLLLTSTLYKILDFDKPDVPTSHEHQYQRQDCIEQIKSTAEDLASTIPYCLNRIKIVNGIAVLNKNEEIKPFHAGLVFFALTIASSLSGVEIEHQRWFRLGLVRLAKILGDGVLPSADVDRWPIEI